MNMEELVKHLIQERLNDIADSMETRAYCLWDQGGTVEKMQADLCTEFARMLRDTD